MRRRLTGGLVYSTDGGRMCPGCRKAVAACTCNAVSATPRTGDGIVRVSRATLGRGGKTVTLVLNLPGNEAAKSALLKDLKAACGTGGTLKDGQLEIQGDHRERVMAELAARGHTVKARGG